ncbi:MAG: hypothetical protein KAR38_12045 [Calditrichia bacterium]|nr:hypothetical protein [Calditrichia bacterium]
MIKSNPWGDNPEISSQTFVHPSAVVEGKVIIEENCYIGPNAVIRADEKAADGSIEPIVIRKNTNIQDGVIIHTTQGKKVEIGPDVSIAHGAVVHGPCTIQPKCFVGFNAVVYNAVLEEKVVVLHNAVVEMVTIPAQKVVPPNATIMQKEDIDRLLLYTQAIDDFLKKVLYTYEQLTFGYLTREKK